MITSIPIHGPFSMAVAYNNGESKGFFSLKDIKIVPSMYILFTQILHATIH